MIYSILKIICKWNILEEILDKKIDDVCVISFIINW